MFPSSFKFTSEMLWLLTVLFGLVDAAFVFHLCRRITREEFRRLKGPLAVASAVVWGAAWIGAIGVFWGSVYRYFFPAWSHWLIPPAHGVLFAVVGLVCWGLAQRVQTNPVVAFALLGGAWGFVTHLWALHLGLVTRPPILRGVSPASVIFISIAMFMFYWCRALAPRPPRPNKSGSPRPGTAALNLER